MALNRGDKYKRLTARDILLIDTVNHAISYKETAKDAMNYLGERLERKVQKYWQNMTTKAEVAFLIEAQSYIDDGKLLEYPDFGYH